MAIGAQLSDVTRPIVRAALKLARLGVAISIPLVFGVTQLIKNQLYGVESLDPTVLLAVIGLL
jgi:hypothetical protein